MLKVYIDLVMSVVVVDVKFYNFLIRKVVEKYKVFKFFLSDWIIGKIFEGVSWGKKFMFIENEEFEMVDVVIKRVNMGIGFSKFNFFWFVGVVVKVKGVVFKSGRLLDMWWRRMKKRYLEFFLRFFEVISMVWYNVMFRDCFNCYFKVFGEIVLLLNFYD